MITTLDGLLTRVTELLTDIPVMPIHAAEIRFDSLLRDFRLMLLAEDEDLQGAHALIRASDAIHDHGGHVVLFELN